MQMGKKLCLFSKDHATSVYSVFLDIYGNLSILYSYLHLFTYFWNMKYVLILTISSQDKENQHMYLDQEYIITSEIQSS